MPDAIITSTASTFGTISGTFAADQSTIVGTVAGSVVGTLTGSVGVPGPQGPTGPQGPIGPEGPPGEGGTWGSIVGDITAQTDLWTQLGLKAPLASPVFTGDARAVTAGLGDNDTSIATTAFVQQELLSGTANARNLEVYVRNQTGSTIPAGSIVYINGATGNRPTITLAQANNDANSAQTFGFVKTSIANNGFGFVIVRGELENIDTSALTEGVQLYLSPTTPGTWTTTKPSAPQHLVYVGIVVRAHPTQGVILVAVQNGYELDELHDVQIVSPTNGQVLKYNSTSGLWYNATDSAGVAWGGITGTLSSQTDLQTALDGKYSTSNPAGYITSSALTGYATESFVTSQGYITSSALTPYLTSATAASTYQTLSGMSSYLTTSAAASTYYPLTGNPSGFITSAALSNYAPLASPALTGNVTITSNSTGAALFIEQAGTGNILTLHDQAADTNFVAIDANGKVSTIPSVAGGAGFNIAHGTAPTTPVNGDVWTTTSGLFARINGATRQYVDLDGTQTINGAKTFSNANQTLGNSTAAGTINIGTGATISGATKAVNLGTSGVAGSTTNITIGSTTGTSTTTLQGITNGVTQSAGDSSLKLATTAFVTTADNLKANLASPTFTGTPLSTTAAVDTNTTQIATTAYVVGQGYLKSATASATYAPIASPALSGVPTAPTATAGTNTTQIATTAFVTAAVPATATVAEALRPSSATLAMTPDTTREMLMYPGYLPMYGGGVISTSGAGASGSFTFATQRWHELVGPNTATAGYSSYAFDSTFSGVGMVAMTRGVGSYYRKWNSKIWASGRSMVNAEAGGYAGDANTFARVMVGGRSSIAAGGMVASENGIGWKVAGGGSAAMILTVSNGSTLTETTSSFTPTGSQVFDWKIYSDGSGNVTLWVNDSQVATSTGGPTTSTAEQYNMYLEIVDQTASATARFALYNFGTKVFWSQA